MSLGKLPADCLSVVMSYLPLTSIQELAITRKDIRAKCLLIAYDQPVIMPISKIMYPEILLKTASTIAITQSLVEPGVNWLLVVLSHFKHIRTVRIVLKRLSRRTIQAIWEIVNKVSTVKVLAVPNTEFCKWCHSSKSKSSGINIKPLFLKNVQQDTVQVLEDYVSEQIHVIQKFNEYMSNATKKYESGYKLDGPIEALALSNILSISNEDNAYGANQDDWEAYIKKTTNPPLLSPDENIKTIIEEYTNSILKNDNQAFTEILSKYKRETSAATNFCLEALKNIDENTWLLADTEEEDLFIKNFVDTMVINPLFNTFPNDVKKHGNGHTLKESRHRKIKQAKQNGDTVKGWKGRSPDRSLELRCSHVFICEVKTLAASKSHPDLAKLGTMLKDILDHALERGVTREYATTGLLVEGLQCTVYSMTMAVPKLYHMTKIQTFDLPSCAAELRKLNTVIESMMACKSLIDLSCCQLRAVDDQQTQNICISGVPTCSSPPHYVDYYK